MAKFIIAAVLMASGFYPSQVGVTRADFEPKVAPPPAEIVKETKKVWVTAYSSTPEETDDTPFITASGRIVEDGIVAANFLPFGAKVRIPELFGEKVFTVYDRMHERKTNVVDVWMPSKEEAKRFGAAYTEIIVLE